METVIIRGIPGCGKTCLAHTISGNMGWAHYHLAKYVKYEGNGKGGRLAVLPALNHLLSELSIRMGKSIVEGTFDDTNLLEWFLDQLPGEKRVVTLTVSLETLLRKRPEQETLIRRLYKSWKNVGTIVKNDSPQDNAVGMLMEAAHGNL